jgi:hypothetical protein
MKNKRLTYWSIWAPVVAVIVGALLGKYLPDWREDQAASQSEVQTNIPMVILRQDLKSGYWNSEIFLNILNRSEKPAWLVVDSLVMSVREMDSQLKVWRLAHPVRVEPKSQCKESLNVTIFPRGHLDSSLAQMTPVKATLYISSISWQGQVNFDGTDSLLAHQFELGWESFPPGLFNALQKMHLHKSLPSEWGHRKYRINDKWYDCFFRPPNASFDIEEESGKYRLVKLPPENSFVVVHPREGASGEEMGFLDFVPDPSAAPLIRNLGKASFTIVMALPNKGQDEVVTFHLPAVQGYRSIYCVASQP